MGAMISSEGFLSERREQDQDPQRFQRRGRSHGTESEAGVGGPSGGGGERGGCVAPPGPRPRGEPPPPGPGRPTPPHLHT